MSTLLMIYLADIVGRVSATALCFGILLGIMCCCSMMDYYDSESKSSLKISTICGIFSLLSTGVSVFTPSSKAIYTIAAVKFGQEFVEKPDIKLLGDKVYRILNDKLDQFDPKKDENTSK